MERAPKILRARNVFKRKNKCLSHFHVHYVIFSSKLPIGVLTIIGTILQRYKQKNVALDVPTIKVIIVITLYWQRKKIVDILPLVLNKYTIMQVLYSSLRHLLL